MGPWDSLQFCCQGRSIVKSKGIMIKIIIPSIVVEQALLMKLPVLGQCLPKVVEKDSLEVGANVGDLFSNAMS
jgi:hypothetical protein